MISPERLRMYPFFGFLNPEELSAIAMLANATAYPEDTVIFQSGASAKTLYLLEKGCIELYYESFDPIFKPELRRKFLVGEINPGEAFGISSLVDPYQFTASAVAAAPSLMIEIPGEQLRALLGNYPTLDCALYQQVIHTLMERLHYTRVQLAAERAS